MKYFGIKKPKTKYTDSYIFWFGIDKHSAWVNFFVRSDQDFKGIIPNGICMDEAMRAYEAIGYKCVEVDIKEK